MGKPWDLHHRLRRGNARGGPLTPSDQDAAEDRRTRELNEPK
jgi:hypothetical protein